MSQTGTTHDQILKSSALIGGSSVVSVFVGMIRQKYAAIYLGPHGVGLLGTYMTILTPLTVITGMGIAASAVRQIAESAGENNRGKLARSVLSVRRASRICGLFGMTLVLVLAFPLSNVTFGNTAHVLPLCILSLSLLIGSVAGGMAAVIQGLRRIRDMAAQTAIGAVIGLPVAVCLMIIWGERSIVPMLLLTALIGMIITWWFARRVKLDPVQMSWRDTWFEAKPMIHLGMLFMSTGLMASGAAYLIRVMIIRKLGLDGVGIYSAAWTLSSYYVGFILNAMGADFYPRLTEVNKNNHEVNRLVNEQTEVGLLIALPGILATLTLTPLVIHLFYTAKFLPAVELLQWQTLGVLLRVSSWPIGFMMIAKSAKSWFFASESAAYALLLLLTWRGIISFGINGAGIAFFAMYACLSIWTYFIARRVTALVWTLANIRLICASLVLSIIAFLGARFLPLVYSTSGGLILSAASAWYSLRTLTRLVGHNPLLAFWIKAKQAIPALGRVA